jgi:putative ATP-dependent endonuclease of OLD family
MKISKISIKNFRLLESPEIFLDNQVTLIVGRNNSGKTSLTEIFYKFFGPDKSQFKFEDFSTGTYDKLKEAVQKYKGYKDAKAKPEDEEVVKQKEDDYKKLIPEIELNIFIEYETNDNLASLQKFIMDLDPARKDALISCQYAASDQEKLFEDFLTQQEKYKNSIIEFLKKNHRTYFKETIYAIDINNLTNAREIEKISDIENVFISSFIYAQNQLDDQSTDKSKGLSKGFEEYYKINNRDNATVEEIETALQRISDELDEKYANLFNGIFADLKEFGINEGVNLQDLKIKCIFEADKILKGNTQLFYNHEENLLPEAHNGLGYSKLIFTILRFISFYEQYSKRKPKPNFQVIFVEEPEAHLHPQMQYVFIKNIKKFIATKTGWCTQVIITTHSPHIVAESGFDNIRYFDISDKYLKVKNLSDFQNKQTKENPDSISFLKQYMCLNKCDIFFADKIIMIEGTVERLLLPEMIRKECKTLPSQYISIIEIGGAYAHNFRELINFINVKTLVVTDIDSVDPTKNRCACPVGTKALTCNQTLAKWIPQEENIGKLLQVSDEGKTENKIRVAYQVPESKGETCGRSFEEQFILTNARIFCENNKDISVKNLFQNGSSNKSEDEIKKESYVIAEKITKKTDFAFDVLVLENWTTPKYIKDGLLWLEQ